MQTILITGAGRGIGLALTRAIIARGDAVIATARDPEAAEALAAVIAGAPESRLLPLDVTDPESCHTLAGALTGVSIDALICNAGVYEGRGKITDPSHTLDGWTRSLMTNVAGPFFTIRALLPLLARPGRIGIVSSKMGSQQMAGGGGYAYRASKAAAINLARNLAVDLKADGIAVAAWHPGWVRTDMGGGGADISVEQSAEGLLARLDELSLETTGSFQAYDGETLPW
ncbi:MAG: NAD(P)-dependent dehydrogenase (short-subunit alcohol dehydrogenase family) [Paracoccaceae bacterium]|jgi:NAD(P)-dependent dehydrogenase (short-subunit alcohol dehydrogenase family)